MSLKNRLTAAVYEQLRNPDSLLVTSIVNAESCDSLYNIMWKNTSLSGGFALTSVGVDYLVEVLKLKHWAIDVDVTQVTSSDILLLERYMLTPFYLTKLDGRTKSRVLIVFDEQIATQIILYGGNLRHFLQAQDAASGRAVTDSKN